MKKWITLVAITAIFSACTKQNLQEDSLQVKTSASTSNMRSSQEGAYVSGWEQYSDWDKTDEGGISRFSFIKKLAEINAAVINGGLVLTYAKVATSDPAYKPFTVPKMLPFYYLPEAERPYPNQFYFSETVAEGSVTLTYSIPFTKEAMPAMGGGVSLPGFQFQYVVLTKAFLDAHGVNAQTVKNYYTYEQVMALVNS